MHRTRSGPAWNVTVAALMWGCAVDQEMNPGVSGLWEVDAAPLVVIGRPSAQPDEVLHQVVDAVRLSDGSMAVASGGLRSRLSVFSEEGVYLRTIGRTGDGPGEFRWITSLEVGVGDSLLVFDASAQRLTAISPDGGVRTTQARVTGDGAGSGAGAFRTVSRLQDNVWAGTGMGRPMQGPLGVIIRDTIAIGLVDRALTEFRPLAHLPGMMSTTFEVGGRRAFGPPAFSPSVLQTTWGRCVFIGIAEDRSIDVYSSQGDLVTSFEGPGRPRQATQDDFDRWVVHRLSLADEGERNLLRQAFSDIARVADLPYYSQMIADRWGRVWLQEYSPPMGPGRRWFVLSQTGKHLGDVLLPRPMTVFEITESGVLGRTVGDLDEEYVELFPLGEVPPRASGHLPQCLPVKG